MDKEELKQIYASIHTLRMEGDRQQRSDSNQSISFQSTPSAWRVTGKILLILLHPDISIHTLRMEGDRPPPAPLANAPISIHTLRVESDPTFLLLAMHFWHSNAHPPHGG